MSFVLSDADVDDEVVEVESAIAYCCRLSSAAKHNHCHCVVKKSATATEIATQRFRGGEEEGRVKWIFAGASESGGSKRERREVLDVEKDGGQRVG